VVGGLVALGCAGLLVNAYHNTKYSLRPIRVPIAMMAGDVAQAEFVAELSAVHEVELACLLSDAPQDVRTALRTRDTASRLDVEWSVVESDQVIAEGNCRDYLYITTPGLLRRLHDAVLCASQDFNVLPDHGARGVGRFHAEAGKRYTVRAEVGSTLAQFNSVNPVLGVRLDRLFWRRHTQQTAVLAYVGLAVCGIAGVLLAINLGTAWRAARRAGPTIFA
jgi:hypothetical protein